MLRLFLIFILLLASDAALAVDGFQSWKFGMTLGEVKSKNLCNLKIQGKSGKQIETYSCDDFNFNKHNTTAVLYFIDKKLERVILAVGKSYSDMESVAIHLRGEFGSPTAMYDLKAIKAFNAGLRDELSIGFEANTVFLKFFKYNEQAQVTMTYSSEDYYNKALNPRKPSRIASDY